GPVGLDGTALTGVISNLAGQIEPGELIVLRLGNAQCVPKEGDGRLESGREIGARVDGGVGALECDRLAATNDREAGLIVDDLARFELDVLQVSVRASGLQAVSLHLAGDILDGLTIAVAADVAALQLIVGKKLDVRPPEVALGDIISGKQGRGAKQEKDGFTHETPCF